MANDITSWSTTANDNATLDGLTWAEGQAASSVNNSARQMMASIKAWYNDTAGGKVAGGTANAITLTSDVGFTALGNGIAVTFKASNDNTGATTLNVNALGAKSVRKMTLAGDVALVGGEIQDDGIYIAHYSEDANSAAGGWILVNPTTIGGAISGTTGTFTGALTATSATISGTAPIITLTDTDTNADCQISGSSANGTLRLDADLNNEASNSALQFAVDGTVVATANDTAWHCGKTSLNIATAGVSLGTDGTVQITRSGGNPLDMNRLSSVGDMMYLRIAGTVHSTVAIDGSGVTTWGTFCGAHWSQLSDNSNPDLIPGTVVETIDEMAHWEGEEIPNHHLARFKVSDTHASPRVYGVWQRWDDDGDAIIHSLGASTVRINKDAVVQGGDVLVSNGDGTAVPLNSASFAQVVAKVTAAVKVKVFEDGSYLVPATLHCG